MNILVTGANGQLGSEIRTLAEHIREHNFVFVSSAECDIRNQNAIEECVTKYEIKGIINCAAYTAVDLAEDEPDQAFAINSSAVGNLVAIAEKFQLRLIHISTDYVFDGNFSDPIQVDEKKNPLGVYGKSKSDGEDKILASSSDSIVIRTSWVYSSFGKNFVKTMLRLMSERHEISVVGDQVGSPTYAKDLAQACIDIITNQEKISANSRIYHFSNSGIVSWYDFALAIAEIASKSVSVHKIRTEDYPTKAIRPAYSALDTASISSDFGIRVRDWKSALEECINKLV